MRIKIEQNMRQRIEQGKSPQSRGSRNQPRRFSEIGISAARDEVLTALEPMATEIYIYIYTNNKKGKSIILK